MPSKLANKLLHMVFSGASSLFTLHRNCFPQGYTHWEYRPVYCSCCWVRTHVGAGEQIKILLFFLNSLKNIILLQFSRLKSYFFSSRSLVDKVLGLKLVAFLDLGLFEYFSLYIKFLSTSFRHLIICFEDGIRGRRKLKLL